MYADINFWRFALAAGVVTLPALWLEDRDPRWAWRYVLLILLGIAVVNAGPIGAFLDFVRRELGIGGKP